VLTNRGTASAAEVLAMSLAGNGRAHIIGERTFGKALIQHPYRLADGSILTITVAEYLSPGPRVRHLGTGLVPQAACFSSPLPPSESAPVPLRDLCIAAAEADISATLRWPHKAERHQTEPTIGGIIGEEEQRGEQLGEVVRGRGGQGGGHALGGMRNSRAKEEREEGGGPWGFIGREWGKRQTFLATSGGMGWGGGVERGEGGERESGRRIGSAGVGILRCIQSFSFF
jgi:hypothetical protein